MTLFNLLKLFASGNTNPQSSPRAPVIQAYVYGFSGLILSILTLIVACTAPEGTLNYTIRVSISLGAIGLPASAILSLKAPFWGRVGALLSLFGLGWLWFPMGFLLVPRLELHVPLHIYLTILIYYFTVFFSLFYPRPTGVTWLLFFLISIFVIFVFGLAIAGGVRVG